ncbi:MAG: DUF4115 domain-containing protein [Syntrophales bacterium]|nr:DUF4115 domain-containing protein [Syntrophales bacterium]
MDDLSQQEPNIVAPTVDFNLKSIREAKGISIRDIFMATRITTVNLEAIEDGRYYILPEPVYAKTFIKAYAKFLDIDSRPILDRYDLYLKSLSAPAGTGNNLEEQSTAQPKTGGKLRWLRWAAAAAIILVALFFLIFNYESDIANKFTSQNAPPLKSDSAASSNTQPVQPADTQKSSLNPEAPSTTPREGTVSGVTTPGIPGKAEEKATASRQSMPEGMRYRLVIKASDDAWLRIRADRRQPEEIMLNKDDNIERFASDAFTVDIGNAGGVDVIFQGKSMGALGKKGQVVHLNLPQNSL